MKHIVNLSGGKDSTAMLLMMLDRTIQLGDAFNVREKSMTF